MGIDYQVQKYEYDTRKGWVENALEEVHSHHVLKVLEIHDIKEEMKMEDQKWQQTPLFQALVYNTLQTVPELLQKYSEEEFTKIILAYFHVWLEAGKGPNNYENVSASFLLYNMVTMNQIQNLECSLLTT